MKALVFDTESSGMIQWSLPSETPTQPHLTQLTALLFDDVTDTEEAYIDIVVRQDGFTVDAEAFAKHKITPEHSFAVGLPEEHALNHFEAMLPFADVLVGFSLNFDIRMLRVAMARFGRDAAHMDAIQKRCDRIKYDIQHKCTDLAKIPPTRKMMAAGRKSFKPPSLEEAARAILGIEMGADAHDSRGDVLATKDLYLHILKVKGRF